MDITERKLAEQALRDSERRERDAAERLRALDEMKNTFLAAVSHELRSPLTSILGLSITLERTPEMPDGDRADLLERLAVNARKLDRLLKDLLDIDRLNRGIVEPQYRTVDIAALTRRSVESLDTLGDHPIELELEPLIMRIDPPKLERIVENLVANAARHTPSTTRIWVRLERTDERCTAQRRGRRTRACRRSCVAAVFEPFRQGPTTSAHSPGTGIGLSLVARFAELHGGRAWVEERAGGGAAFRVFLPAGPDDRSDRPADHGCGSTLPSVPSRRRRTRSATQRVSTVLVRRVAVGRTLVDEPAAHAGQQASPAAFDRFRRSSSACRASSGSISRVRSASITSWRSSALETRACTMAATGNAMKAPISPAMLAPAIAHPNATAACSSIVFAVIRGLEQVVLDLLVRGEEEQEHERLRRGSPPPTTSSGSAIAMYVPTVGMNCETSPIHTASGTANGMPRAVSTTNVASPEITASSNRE